MSKNAHAIHILPLRVYLTVGATLLAFTFITVYVSTLDFGEWNLVVAMLIAATKALLVAFFFMHLFYDSKVYFSIFVGALLFLAVFIIFTMFDTQARGRVNAIQGTPIEEKAIIYRENQGTAVEGKSPAASPAATSSDSTKAAKPGSTQTDSSSHGAPARTAEQPK